MQTPINPLKRERLELQLSPEQMANIANIQPAAIGQAEEGFYPNPLPSYLLALGVIPGSVREKKITQEYKDYQLAKRRINGPHSSNFPKLIINPTFNAVVNPLASWRKQSRLATYGLCSAFCIHMPLVNRFEKQISTFTEIPPTKLMDALYDAGYGLVEGLLDEFVEACQVHKASISNRVRLANNLPPVGVVVA